MTQPKSIRLLLVVDGYFSLGPQDRDDRSFSVSHLISLLKGTSFTNGPRIYLDTAHRDGDQNATIWGKFHFVKSVPDLTVYDEIWMFGYNGPNANDKNNPDFTKPIDDSEVEAIANFMQNGGGVLADGDHDGLGCYMCGRIPRVKTMRKWFVRDDPNPDVKPDKYTAEYGPKDPKYRNWPARGEDRADTLQQDVHGEFNFTNQSDDIPQPLALIKDPKTGGFHPILEIGPSKYLDKFPDHFHEGEVLGFGGVKASEPWSTTETFTLYGKTLAEYPKSPSSEQELPQIIAMGHVIGDHATIVETDKLCDSGFRPDSSKTKEKRINTLSVYDGHKHGIGRVLTDSSFHHFVDLNLIGDPCASEEKTLGFDRGFLKDMTTFYVNCAIWLANKRVYVDEAPVFGAREKR